MCTATLAAKLSLSVTLMTPATSAPSNAGAETASFSLMIGTTRMACSWLRVVRRFSTVAADWKSRLVTRTWAVWIPYWLNIES